MRVPNAWDYPARELTNSLALPSVAQHCVAVTNETQLSEIVQQAQAAQMPLNLLGGGTNVIAMPEVVGLTALMRITGLNAYTVGDRFVVEVGAGESWQGFVRYCLGQGIGQLANLSLIPGTVGAAPMQNIGAYGVEVGTYIEAVRVLDRRRGEFEWKTQAQCEFGYRDSLFRRQLGEFIITQVRFSFAFAEPVNTSYAGIDAELSRMSVLEATPVAVAEAVSRIRRRKLPDPRTIPNAGSFFKNPVVSRTEYAQLESRLQGIACWPADPHSLNDSPGQQGVKLSAAALIEQAVGIDRRRTAAAGVYPWRLQPLVLVHRGGCDGKEVLRVAAEIASAVEQRFAVQLEREPRVFGAGID